MEERENVGVQHRDAVQALEIIIKAYKEYRVLTYTELARLLGKENPSDYARAMGGVCDKLDAACCFAKVPQMPLAVVREEEGYVNRRAWFGRKERGIAESLHEQVVDCAVHHH